MKFIKIYKLLFFIGALLAFNACSDDDAELGPAPVAGLSVSPESILLEGEEITFINESTGGKSYFWSFGDGNTTYGTSVSHTYVEPGDYTVTLEASANGQRDVASINITIEALQYELYFINNDALQIQKINLNTPDEITPVFDAPGFGIGLAYDSENEELYYSDDDNFTIYKNSINGGNQSVVADGFDGPRDIALDITNNRLFVNEKFLHEVVEVDLTNGTKSTIFSSTDDANFQRPEGIDLYNNQLFMTAVEIDAETVWTGETDGSDLTRIIDYSAGGYGYAIEVDKINEKIYFDDFDTGSLLMSDLSGENIEVVGSSSDQVYGIAINNATGKIYWVSVDGIIKEANLDGSEERIIADVAADVRGLIIRNAN